MGGLSDPLVKTHRPFSCAVASVAPFADSVVLTRSLVLPLPSRMLIARVKTHRTSRIRIQSLLPVPLSPGVRKDRISPRVDRASATDVDRLFVGLIHRALIGPESSPRSILSVRGSVPVDGI